MWSATNGMGLTTDIERRYTTVAAAEATTDSDTADPV